MRTLLSLLSVAVCLSAQAASYRFDMGGPNTPLTPGYTLVTSTTTLDKSPDFGWTKPATRVVNLIGPMNPYFPAPESTEFTLYSDGVLSVEENTFEFKVEPGRYKVCAVIGNLAPGVSSPGNALWANGVQIASDQSAEASVKALTFPVDAGEGRISLRFRADAGKKYATVMGVTADPLPAGADCPKTVVEFPARQPGPADYQRNWQAWQSDYVKEWDKAKGELKAEGVDVDAWQPKVGALKGLPGYRRFAVCGASGDLWARLDPLAGGINPDGVCRVYREMGIDMVLGGDPVVARDFPKRGIAYGIYGGGETLYGLDKLPVALNLLKDKSGVTSTRAGVFCNVDPNAAAGFRQYYLKYQGAYAAGASLFMVDEPRGQWFVGGKFGDYSAPCQEAFRAWAAAQGWNDAGAAGIPDRGRTMEFYRFYLFRLETPAMLVEAAVKGTPLAAIPAAPGNGRIGPEQMNHNCYWPPAVARRGMMANAWLYEHPANAKMYAETLHLADEFGGKTVGTTNLRVYPKDTPLTVLPMNTAAVSALNDIVNGFGFSPALVGPDITGWMKTSFLVGRLTHATSGLVHTPPLYVWLPESAAYNDLVELKTGESDNWGTFLMMLFNANMDYTVTNQLKIPPQSVLLYSCARPVLSEEEFARLKRFMDAGGTLVTTFDGAPETPDGKPLAGWAALPADRIVRASLSAAPFKEKVSPLLRRRNLEAGTPDVKSYLYERAGAAAHLLNNTNLEKTLAVTLPVAMTDAITGQRYAAGAAISLPPGRYALLEEKR